MKYGFYELCYQMEYDDKVYHTYDCDYKPYVDKMLKSYNEYKNLLDTKELLFFIAVDFSLYYIAVKKFYNDVAQA